MSTRGLGLVALVVASACATVARDEHPAKRWREPRAEYVRRSQVWLGRDADEWVRRMRSLDLRTGVFEPEASVACTYVEPDDDTFSGATPKFLCRRRDDVFKVKWGADNGEVYAEVAGTRLFAALGFGADRDDPVHVACDGCADDPWRDRVAHPGRTVEFEPAIAEHSFPGVTIQERKHQGWTWAELAAVDPAAGGAPRAHVDAFELLAAFVQHRDSKADNQRLVCLPDGVDDGGGGSPRSCRRPFMLIGDFGSTFGGPSLVATHKMSLEAWAGRGVWYDARQCIADVTSEWDARDGLDRPRIGDAGRRFLATLLAGLDHAQVTALFTVARADTRGGVAGWVAAFEEKRAQVAHPVPSDPAFRCPDGG